MGGENLQCCYREQLAFSLYSRFREPKLYRMAVNGDWDEIPSRCLSHPKEAAFRHKYAPNDTALHRLLRSTGVDYYMNCDEKTANHVDQTKLEAILALIEVDRSLLLITDAFGRTPLHLACMDASEFGVITATMLLEANPQAATLVDVERRTPLHYVLARHDRMPLPLLHALCEQGPSALQIADATRETPLDLLQRRNDEISNANEVRQLLQEAESFGS